MSAWACSFSNGKSEASPPPAVVQTQQGLAGAASINVVSVSASNIPFFTSPKNSDALHLKVAYSISGSSGDTASGNSIKVQLENVAAPYFANVVTGIAFPDTSMGSYVDKAGARVDPATHILTIPFTGGDNSITSAQIAIDLTFDGATYNGNLAPNTALASFSAWSVNGATSGPVSKVDVLSTTRDGRYAAWSTGDVMDQEGTYTDTPLNVVATNSSGYQFPIRYDQQVAIIQDWAYKTGTPLTVTVDYPAGAQLLNTFYSYMPGIDDPVNHKLTFTTTTPAGSSIYYSSWILFPATTFPVGSQFDIKVTFSYTLEDGTPSGTLRTLSYTPWRVTIGASSPDGMSQQDMFYAADWGNTIRLDSTTTPPAQAPHLHLIKGMLNDSAVAIDNAKYTLYNNKGSSGAATGSKARIDSIVYLSTRVATGARYIVTIKNAAGGTRTLNMGPTPVAIGATNISLISAPGAPAADEYVEQIEVIPQSSTGLDQLPPGASVNLDVRFIGWTGGKDHTGQRVPNNTLIPSQIEYTWDSSTVPVASRPRVTSSLVAYFQPSIDAAATASLSTATAFPGNESQPLKVRILGTNQSYGYSPQGSVWNQPTFFVLLPPAFKVPAGQSPVAYRLKDDANLGLATITPLPSLTIDNKSVYKIQTPSSLSLPQGSDGTGSLYFDLGVVVPPGTPAGTQTLPIEIIPAAGTAPFLTLYSVLGLSYTDPGFFDDRLVNIDGSTDSDMLRKTVTTLTYTSSPSSELQTQTILWNATELEYQDARVAGAYASVPLSQNGQVKIVATNVGNTEVGGVRIYDIIPHVGSIRSAGGDALSPLSQWNAQFTSLTPRIFDASGAEITGTFTDTAIYLSTEGDPQVDYGTFNFTRTGNAPNWVRYSPGGMVNLSAARSFYFDLGAKHLPAGGKIQIEIGIRAPTAAAAADVGKKAINSTVVTGAFYSGATRLSVVTPLKETQEFRLTENNSATLSGSVFKDLNADGVLNPMTEGPIAGALVSLYTEDAATPGQPSETPAFSVYTYADGTYRFEQLPGKNYFIRFNPSGFPGATLSPKGADSKADATGLTARLVLPAGGTLSNISAGFVRKGSVSVEFHQQTELGAIVGSAVTPTGLGSIDLSGSLFSGTVTPGSTAGVTIPNGFVLVGATWKNYSLSWDQPAATLLFAVVPSNVCTLDEDCPAGNYCANGTCVPGCTKDADCPQVDYCNRVTSRCEPRNCPSGQYYDTTQKSCLCADPRLVLENGSCVTSCSPPKLRDGAVCECPGGTQEDSGGVCLPVCDSDFILDSHNVCVCKDSHKINFNGQCVYDCPVGTVSDNAGACVCPTPGQAYSASTQHCVDICPTPFSYQNGFCACAAPKVQWTGQCLDACPQGTTADAQGLCQPLCPANTHNNGLGVCIPDCANPNLTLVNGICVCPDGKVLSNNVCVASCPSGKRLDGATGQCVDVCTPPQVSDGTGHCANTCAAPFVPINGQCECATGYHPDGNGSCIVNCASPFVLDPAHNTCGCPSGTIRAGDQCVDDQCPVDTVRQSNGSCECPPNGTPHDGTYHCPAPPTCKGDQLLVNGTCQCPGTLHDDGTGTGTCVLCPAGFHDGGDGHCLPVPQCSDGYRDDGTGHCVRDAGCAEPQYIDHGDGICACADGYHDDGKGTCVKDPCPSGKVLNGDSCVKRCDNGLFDNGTGTCATTCASGYTKVGDQCEKVCSAGQVDDGTGSCATQCKAGFTLTQGRCLCPDGKVESNGACIPVNCASGFVYRDGKCSCPDGQFENGQGACATECAAGYQPKDGECRLVCSDGQHDNGKGTCVPVAPCADGYLDHGDERCHKCPAGQLDNGLGTCATACADGFHNDGTGTCIPDDQPECGNNTLINHDDGKGCVCKDTTKVLSNGACISQCPNGSAPIDGKCIATCPAGQKDNGTGKCASTCAAGYRWDAAAAKCLLDCPQGQYDDGTGHCIGLTCEEGYVADSTGVCALACPDGKHNDGNGFCIVEPSCAEGYRNGGDGTCVPVGPCAEGFIDHGDGVCVKSCPKGQHDNGAGTCVTDPCASGYTLKQGECVLVCPLGQSDDGTGHCAATCVAGFTKVGLDCVKVCPAGQHDDGKGSCVTIGCANGYAIIDGLCALTCPDGQVDDGTGHCAPATCATGFVFKDGVCVKRCPAGQLDNGKGNCAANCTTGYVLKDGICKLDCPDRKHDNGQGVCVDTGTCSPGYVDPGDQDCTLICPAGKFNDGTGHCSDHCATNFHNDGTNRCIPDTPPECAAPLINEDDGQGCRCPAPKVLQLNGSCADACDAGFTLHNGKCVKDCPTGQHDDGTGICTDVQHCASGYTLVGGDCKLDCPAGEYDDGTGHCIGNVPCADGYLVGPDGRCQLTCPTGYHNGGDGKCVLVPACSPGFRDGGDGKCVPVGACADGFHDLGDGLCVKNCPAGQYDNGKGTCVDSPCAAGYVLHHDHCVLECPLGMADDGTGHCAPVIAPCATGYTRVDGECVKVCEPGYHDNGKGTCVPSPTCAAGYTSVDGYCILDCPAGRHDNGTGVCAPTHCAPGYVLENGACRLDCPVGQLDNGKGVCAATCATGYVLKDGLCKLDCPDQTHDNGLGQCISVGTCSPGYVDHGDEDCELVCPTGQHDNGTGICVTRPACAVGYHDDGTGHCVPVGPCADPFVDLGDGKGCVCPNSLVAQGGTCVPSCNPGYTLDPATNRCLKDCPQGQHDNGQGVCRDDITQDCAPGYLWIDAHCVLDCPSGQRDDGTGHCRGDIRCDDGFFADENGVCVKICPPGTRDTGDHVCRPYECRRDTDCGDGGVCDDGVCKNAWKVVQGGGGCSTGTGGMGAIALLAAGLALLGLRRRGLKTLGVAASACLLIAGGSAQAAELQAHFDLQRFRPSMGQQDILGIESPTTALGGFGFGGIQLLGDYAYRPLVVQTSEGHQTALIKSQTGLNLGATLGLASWAEFSVVLPMTADFAPNRAEPGIARMGDLSSIAVTGLRMTPKARFLRAGALSFGLAVPVEVPFKGGNFQEAASVSANPELLLEYTGPFRLAANGGAVFRKKSQFVDVDLGNAFTYGGGISIPLIDSAHKLDLLGTVEGEVGLQQKSHNEHPLEGLAAARWTLPMGLNITAGGGAGILHGYGAPEYRVLAGLGYTPQGKSTPVVPIAAGDFTVRVKQGEPATLAILDKATGAPRKDLRVVALTSAKNGRANVLADQSVRYLPNPDFVGTEQFMYKLAAEDGRTAVGHVAVTVEPKVVIKPSKTDKKVKLTDTGIIILEQVQFATNRDQILPASFPLLNSVAKVLAEHPELAKVRIEGHTDTVGKPDKNLDLSQRRAASVMRYLTSHGISSERLLSQGYGQTQPIASNRTVKGRAQNRRVAFTILDRAQ